MAKYYNNITTYGTFTVGIDDTGHDVKFFGATSGKYMLWDESDDALTFQDSTYLAFGAGNDLLLYHNGTNSYIENDEGHLYINNKADDKDIIFKSDDGSGGTTAYLTLDGSAGRTYADKTIRFRDSVNLEIGNSGDMDIYHDATDTFIENHTGDLKIINTVNDKDIIFQSDDGSGGVETYFYLDGSSSKLLVNSPTIFYDTIEMASYIYHNGDTDTYFGFNAANTFKIFTGGTEALQIDSSQDATFAGAVSIDRGALSISGDGSNAATFTESGGGALEIATVGDLTLDTGGEITLDMNDATYFDITNEGNLAYRFTAESGAGSDIIIYEDGGDSSDDYFAISVQNSGATTLTTIDNAAAAAHFEIAADGNITLDPAGSIALEGATTITGAFTVGVDGTGHDVKFFGTTSGKYMLWDESEDHLLFRDATQTRWGTNGDLRIYHDGSNSYIEQQLTGDLYIYQGVADRDIIFSCDDGAGNNATYFYLDGSAAVSGGARSIIHPDNVKSKWGDSGDFILYHDGTDSYIKNNGGDVIIQNTANDKDIVLKSDNGSGGTAAYLTLDGSAGLTTVHTPMQLVEATEPDNPPAGHAVIWLHEGGTIYAKITVEESTSLVVIAQPEGG